MKRLFVVVLVLAGCGEFRDPGDLHYARTLAVRADPPRVPAGQRARIDLLVTDVGLPGGMNGRQLAEMARQQRPKLRALLITGYAEAVASRHGPLDPGMDLMTKPFQIDELAARIRDMVRGTR